MKHLLPFLTLLFLSSFGFAQIIDVNDVSFPESSYDPEDLIKNVMISASCSTAVNFIFQVNGAPDDLTTKSYNAFYSPSSEGTYTVQATNRVSGCRIPASTEVVSSYPPENIDVAIKSELFSDNNILEVSVDGIGIYEYRIDFGPWQREPLFENVKIGAHTIYVRDLLNCNEITEKKTVIGYPKFFTPNGDGYHDTWNIVGMTMNSRSKIYIFDCYGKLLNQISPTGKGWDGTFNGVQLPTNDYWFILDFNDPVTGKNDQFRANFTLKR